MLSLKLHALAGSSSGSRLFLVLIIVHTSIPTWLSRDGAADWRAINRGTSVIAAVDVVEALNTATIDIFIIFAFAKLGIVLVLITSVTALTILGTGLGR